MARYGVKGVLAAAYVLFVGAAALAQDALRDVTVETASGRHAFKVELAVTEPEREKGLMFRKTMPQDHGMLFVYQHEEPVIFWMKNTLLPLDMLFIDKEGHVVSIKHDAKPMDESLIPAGAPTLEVLELNAGVAASIGAKTGDKVTLSDAK